MIPFLTIFLVATATPSEIGRPGFVESTSPSLRGKAVVVERPPFVVYSGPTASGINPAGGRIEIDVASSSPALEALARLRSFKSWRNNWDGEGAPRPKADALDTATNLLGLLDQTLPDTPKVALNSFGEPMFMWAGQGRELSVTVPSKATLHFFAWIGSKEFGGSVRFNGEKLPEQLSKAIKATALASA